MRTFLVTGTSRGLGAAIVTSASLIPARVITHARQLRHPADIHGDLGSIAVRRVIADRARDDRVDVFVNSAAVRCPGLALMSTIQTIEHLVEVNITAQMHLLKLVAGAMLESGKPSTIIHVGSLAATHPSVGESLYAASKAALRSYVQVMQQELAGTNVRIISVALGAMDTDMCVHKQDKSTLIRPQDAADAIVAMAVAKPSSLYAAEVVLRRFYA